MLLWISVFEICHSLSSKITGWHWRGHRLLRVALSEISDLGPKWSFATDTHRTLNIRRRISPRWRFWSVAWPNLIEDFLDVQMFLKNACFWQWRSFQVIHCSFCKVIYEKCSQSVCLVVCYFAVKGTVPAPKRSSNLLKRLRKIFAMPVRPRSVTEIRYNIIFPP